MTDSEINDLTNDFRLELTSNPPTTVGEEEDLDNLLDMEDNDTTPTHVGAVPLPRPLPMPHHPDVTTATTPAIQAPALAIGPQPPPIPQPHIMMEPPPTAMPQLPPGLDLDGGIFRRLLTDMMYEIQLIKGMLTSILNDRQQRYQPYTAGRRGTGARYGNRGRRGPGERHHGGRNGGRASNVLRFSF